MNDRLDGRWRNLYRDTDPIGSWALDPATVPEPPVDRMLVDPGELGEDNRRPCRLLVGPGYASALDDLARHAPSGQ
ncbi:MAG TPA: hypothetical protein VK585_17655 [Jiangellaceae bacterium]|nr:hypothetical protein [Jiangellaceae bacterium]